MEHYIPDATTDIYEVENTFYLRSHPTRLAKLISQFELYQSIVHLPGALIECGVYKGASLVRFASFRSLLENPFSRPIIGFDAFGAFPRSKVSSKTDKAFIRRFEDVGGHGISQEGLEEVLAKKGFANVQLIAGDVFDTIPAFTEAQPAQKVALLHLDLDIYEPTAFALDSLMPRVVKGGLVVFDDYTQNSVNGH